MKESPREQTRRNIFRAGTLWAATAALGLAAIGWLVLYVWVILVTLD